MAVPGGRRLKSLSRAPQRQPWAGARAEPGSFVGGGSAKPSPHWGWSPWATLLGHSSPLLRLHGWNRGWHREGLQPSPPPRHPPGCWPRGCCGSRGRSTASGAGAGHRNRARNGARPSPCCTERARSCRVLVAPCGLSLPPSGRASPGLLPSHLHLLCPPHSNRWLLSTVGACTAPSPSASPSPACPARCLGAGRFREGARCPTNPAGTGLPRGASSATERGGQGRKELPGGEEGAAGGIPE